MVNIIGILLEMAREKLADDNFEDIEVTVLEKILTGYAGCSNDLRVQEFLYECQLRRQELNDNYDEEGTETPQDLEYTRNPQESIFAHTKPHAEDNIEMTSNSHQGEDIKSDSDRSTPNDPNSSDADYKIVKTADVTVEATHLNQNGDIEKVTSTAENCTTTFQKEFNKVLEWAKRAMVEDNIDAAEKNVQIAKGICQTLRHIKQVEGTISNSVGVTIMQHDKSENTANEDTTSVKEAKQILEEAKATVREAMAAAKEVKEAQRAVASALKEGKTAMKEAAATAIEETLKERWPTMEESTITEVTKKAWPVIKEVIKVEKAKMEEATAGTIRKEAHTAVEEALNEGKVTIKEARTVMDGLLNEGKKIVDEVKTAAREATAAAVEAKVIVDEAKLSQTQTNRAESNRNNNQPHNSEKPVDPQASKNNKEEAEHWIANAQKAYAMKDYKIAHICLLKANYFDPNANIKDFLADVEVILNYKKEIIYNHIKMADEAIKKKDYKEAENILVKALEIYPTADLNNKLVSVRVTIDEIGTKVKHLLYLANQAKKNNSLLAAQKYYLQARDTDPSLGITINYMIKENMEAINYRKGMANGYLVSADLAIKNEDFEKAKALLLKAFALNVIDVSDRLNHVTTQIASRSSTRNFVREDQSKNSERGNHGVK